MARWFLGIAWWLLLGQVNIDKNIYHNILKIYDNCITDDMIGATLVL